MLEYIIVGLIAIILYQIISTIVYIATKENEDVLSVMAMLVPFSVWNYILRPIIYKIALSWCRKNLNAYRFYWRKGDKIEDRALSNWYATDKNVKNLIQDETKPYFIKKVSDCKNIKSIPYKQDVYKGQPNFKGWDMNKFIEK